MTNNDNIHRLTFEDKEITLIGTAHVSRESADLVVKVIEEEFGLLRFYELQRA